MFYVILLLYLEVFCVSEASISHGVSKLPDIKYPLHTCINA